MIKKFIVNPLLYFFCFLTCFLLIAISPIIIIISGIRETFYVYIESLCEIIDMFKKEIRKKELF